MSSSSLPTFGATTTAEEVADALVSEIKGKNVLVTGTSINGIGFETARAIAKYANLVIITGYNASRLQLSKEAITKEFPSANIRTLHVDLSSVESVRKAGAEVNAYPEPLHVLINNAAATTGTSKPTVDGFEMQMAAGHIGPFLFTKLLAPKILASTSSTISIPRVIFVSSVQHALGDGVPLDKEAFTTGAGTTLPEEHKDAKAPPMFLRYGQVKSANVLTARELSRRAGGRIRAYSLDPGAIVTNAFAQDFKPTLEAIGIIGKDGKANKDFGGELVWKSLGQGAATTVTAAFDPRISDQAGAYLLDCVLAEDKVAAHSSDMVRAKKLWDLTEEVIGEKFEL
ncbi:Short-chain dehydrogenase/reductase family protein [Mycena chlorophos]|uniref:Short-chain dehydrogenase/reductase family protein n=1 Tax=Mycena chlorophos TaxID=658473 RepID=A0A8H6SJB6_MYCCL|nr:Short-chain dehydrogenase/reductase family protein [Mycena chlorophos]